MFSWSLSLCPVEMERFRHYGEFMIYRSALFGFIISLQVWNKEYINVEISSEPAKLIFYQKQPTTPPLLFSHIGRFSYKISI